MRIALVHPRLDHRGGAENVVLWMARGLRERGHDVVVATLRFSEERWSPGDWHGIPLRILGKGRLEGLQTRAARQRAPALRLARALGACDLIVAHNAPAPLWATLAARRMPGARVVWFCHEPKLRLYGKQTMSHLAEARAEPVGRRWPGGSGAKRRSARRDAIDRRLDREGASGVDRVLGNSAFTARNAERVYGVPARPCILGLPEPPKPATVASAAPYVAWLTSGLPHKNAPGFLEALGIAVRRHGLRGLRVRAVGLGDDAFARRIAALGLVDVVERGGWLADDAVNTLIAGARLLAFPSIDEPFGLVPLQAMAHGRPVLAAGVGGPAETVVDGVTGVHADPLDPDDLAAKLSLLWKDPARCDALGAAGRERYLAHFTFEHFLDRFEEAVPILRPGR